MGINAAGRLAGIVLALSLLVGTIGAWSSAASAQTKPGGAKSNTCPGGFSACVERCMKAGGQPRYCPNYCQKQKGC